jgi:hypothetical protein
MFFTLRRDFVLNVTIKHHGCPGDWLCITAACHGVWLDHSWTRFRLDGLCGEMFDDAPWRMPDDCQPDVTVKLDYGWARTDCDRFNIRFIDAFYRDLTKLLHLPTRSPPWNPQLWLSDEEINRPRVLEGDYVVICSGWKRDYPIKNWGFANWQEVTNWIKTKTDWQVVQVGEISSAHHVHRALAGAIDLRGKTNTRDLFLLAYHSRMGLGHESYLHHVYASTFHGQGRVLAPYKPFVCVASGWNPKLWTAYNTEVYLTRQGTMSCCSPGGCNKPNIQACLKPGQVGDERVGKCMASIEVDDVIRAIQSYEIAPTAR